MDKKDCLVNCDRFGRQAAYFESYVVPLWQEIYDSLVLRASIRPGDAVLDVGTGTGEVALRADEAAGPTGKVTAVDIQPEMLGIAREKAGLRRAGNVTFMESPIEKTRLPDDTFDVAVGNYSLCCCADYSGALSEIRRVLKPGGRLVYNHGGLLESEAMVKVTELFETYKTKSPSESLRALRDSDQSLRDAVDKYKDPSITLDLLKGLGYADPTAEVSRRVLAYRNPKSLVDRLVAFDWSAEVAEIPPEDTKKFAAEAVTALSAGTDFRFEDDMVLFTARK